MLGLKLVGDSSRSKRGPFFGGGQVGMRRTRCGLGTLVAAVARSQIAIAEPSGRLSLFPDGFDEVDLAILVWIAGENRWFTRNALRNN